MNALAIDTHYFHHLCIMVLYGATVLAAFIVLERVVYYGLLSWRTGAIARLVSGKSPVAINKSGHDKRLARRDIVSRSIGEYVAAVRTVGLPRSQIEDLSAALYIKTNGAIGARLWLLDTIVTAAPLIGLLGTILGIMDTFNALSAGGISDPAAVSRGIGAALLATAIGIGTALFGLLCHNLLHRWADHLTEEFKRLLLLSDGFAARLPMGQGASQPAPAAAANKVALAAE